MTLDSQAVPKRFDAEYTGDDGNLKPVYADGVRGIYELDGDVFRRSIVIPGRKGTRPNSFDIAPGDGRLLIVLERVKDAEKNPK